MKASKTFKAFLLGMFAGGFVGIASVSFAYNFVVSGVIALIAVIAAIIGGVVLIIQNEVER